MSETVKYPEWAYHAYYCSMSPAKTCCCDKGKRIKRGQLKDKDWDKE